MVRQKELLEMLGISRKTLWRWRQLGLPYHKVERVIYFDVTEVKKWIRSR